MWCIQVLPSAASWAWALRSIHLPAFSRDRDYDWTDRGRERDCTTIMVSHITGAPKLQQRSLVRARSAVGKSNKHWGWPGSWRSTQRSGPTPINIDEGDVL